MARERGRLGTVPGGRTDGRDYDPEMLVPPKRGGRQLLAGAFVLVGIVAVIATLFALTDPGTFRGRYNIFTVVENAGGIRKGDPVQLRGVNIGRVTGFHIVPNGVAVQLELENQYKVPADSRLSLTSSGLLGGMTATIVPGRATNQLEDGDTIPGTMATGAFDEAASLGQRADTVLARAQLMLSTENVGNLSASTAELRNVLAQTAAMVAEDRASIRALTGSLARTSAELEGAHTGQRVAATMAKLDSLTAQLGSASRRMNAASASLQTVIARMESGEGTLGKLSRDPALYDNLNSAAENLNRLAEDIRNNPKKYINVKVF